MRRTLQESMPYEEKALLMRIAEGDEHSFAIFYHYYYQLIFTFLLKHLPSREDAEEVIQQTFLRAWLHREKLANMEFVKAWMFKVAAREYMNHIRNRLAGKPRLTHLDSVDATVPHASIFNIKEIRHLVVQAMETLSPQRRQIFYLSRFEHLSIDEIAASLHISSKTVKNTLTAALAHIREYLAAAGYTVSILILLNV